VKNKLIKIVVITDKNQELFSVAQNLIGDIFEVIVIIPQLNLLSTIADIQPHLVLLDVLLDDFDGIDFCVALRQDNLLKNVRIVFVTARNESFTKIACLDAGADDVINLPIKNLVLIKKIQSLMRLYNFNIEITDNNSLLIDRPNYQVIKDKIKINIPKKEFEILLLLSSAPERVFTMEEILSKIWGNDNLINNKSIPVYIKKLRNKIGDKHIVTVKGIGYKFSYAN
jgi:two-component system alkaline phosphatase synthesis response regulator PhoP